MNQEIFLFDPAVEQEIEFFNLDDDLGGLEAFDTLDLGAFFEEEAETTNQEVLAVLNNPETELELDDDQEQERKVENVESDLLIMLKNESNETVQTFSSRVTADTFKTGLAMTTGVFSTLGSIIGSCGVFCGHGLSAIAQAVNPGMAAPGLGTLGGLNSPGFNIDANGNFNLSGDVDSLSRATGLSKQDLLAGKYSAEDILTAFFSTFGEGMSYLFGFGIVNTLIDGIFDNFMPSAQAA